MLRRLLSSVVGTIQNTNEVFFPNPFNKAETIHFGWLANVSPCFPIKSENISILSKPEEFYQAILSNCKTASNRILLASLYLGNGHLEEKLVESMLKNENFKNNNLKITILLDYSRGSRLKNNSRTMLKPLLEACKKCEISLYHTPVLRGIFKKFTPNRWNELYGVQHMKLYIFDDKLIISGANLSNDYFTNRQDRYFIIEDRHLCNFYEGLIKKVQKFSLQMDKNDEVHLEKNWHLLPYEGNKEEFVKKAGDSIEKYLLESIADQNMHKKEGCDTWVFPLVQMAQLAVEHDAEITERILSEAQNGSKLRIATGYFNLTDNYMNTLINKCRANCDILMAHPEANGFLGAKGMAGGIPWAYSLIADKFKSRFAGGLQENRFVLLEYLRKGWTYHAKGLWYYPPSSPLPCLTLIGSPNFGDRSVKRDLETQVAIITENIDLQKRLHEECSMLYGKGLIAETKRDIPKWVHIMVFLFRDYF